MLMQRGNNSEFFALLILISVTSILFSFALFKGIASASYAITCLTTVLHNFPFSFNDIFLLNKTHDTSLELSHPAWIFLDFSFSLLPSADRVDFR